MYRRGLEGPVTAGILDFTWYLEYKQTVSRMSLCGSAATPVSDFGGSR